MVTPLVREQMSAAVAAIQNAGDIVLACHINPDGDALGSMLALGLGLQSLGKSATMLSADGVPSLYTFLPGQEQIQTHTERRDFDLAVVLDAGDLTRIGSAVSAVSAAPHLMDIDHHVTGNVFGDVRLLDAGAAATAELVYDLLLALNISLTLPIAENLLCGLLTDTGSFRYRNVTPRTMEIGAELIRLGALPDPIAEYVFENRPFAAQKLMGRALERMGRSADGRIVWATVLQADFAEFGASDADTDGIINAVRAVRGAEVALLLREMPSGKLRVSLRAREPFDVSQVAARFGGGGHRLASGCTLDGPPEEAQIILVAEVAKRLG